MSNPKILPDTYTQGSDATVLAVHALRTAADTCAYFLPHVKSTHQILDVGCGPGSITAGLATYVPDGHIIGLDSSTEIITAARAATNSHKNISFQVGNVLSLPFDDESFDVVHTSQVLLHIPQAAAALHEMRRVCKQGGFVACREADIEAVMIWPQHPGLISWSKSARLFCTMAGRMLRSWAIEAGFAAGNVDFTVGVEMHVGEERKVWGQGMAMRAKEDHVQRQKLLDRGWSESDLDEIQEGWEVFTMDETAVYAMPCGQVICWKSQSS